jgi:Ca2+:H+ antiporter
MNEGTLSSARMPALLRDEWFLLVSIISSLAFLVWGNVLLDGLADPAWLTFLFLWLFAVILTSALSVVRHADHLAARLGEPYGTLILTLSVTSIEVMSISAVMVHGANNPTLVRDTLFALVMIILNGMVGLSLLLGAWRRREQSYNFQGANTYLGAIIPLVGLSLILPAFTKNTEGLPLNDAQQVFLVFVAIGLYAVFLAMQTGRHRGYFMIDVAEPAALEPALIPRPAFALHAILLIAYMVPVVYLAEQLAPPVDYLVETLQVPVALGGIIMAILVATPEAVGAVRAATANHLQRSVNIFLGSVLSTIGLTVPAMIVVSHLIGRSMVLGVQGPGIVMLLLTLAVSAVTFASGRTNVIQGVVHLILFAAYLLLMFQG